MKANRLVICSIIISLVLGSCIDEDIVDDVIPESVKITTDVKSLEIGSTFQLEAVYFNNVGDPEENDFEWFSSREDVISINSSGVIEALSAGTSEITLSILGRTDLMDVMTIEASNMTEVVMTTKRTGMAQTTSSYALSGDFSLVDDGSDLELRFHDNFVASSSLPGLFVYLTNNANTNNGALEIAPITQFTGAQSFAVPAGTGINEYSHVLFYCKPFSVKVGDGKFEN